MFVVRNRKIFYIISAFFVGLSFLAITIWGLKLGIEFTGGTLIEVSYQVERPEKTAVEQALSELPIGAYSVRPSGDAGYLLRTRDLTDAEQTAVLSALSLGGQSELTVDRLSSIGPTIGSELTRKALIAIVLVVLSIILYIAYTFRHVSKPVASWKYGLLAIVALVHDIALPAGLFAVLGYFAGVEIDVLFVVALLTILGYSVNDTIVVFDRVRENLRENERLNSKENFDVTVGKSLEQTYERSINTSMTVLLVLLALYFLGGSATENFALALLAGVVAGAYSSVFLATPLLVTIAQREKKQL